VSEGLSWFECDAENEEPNHIDIHTALFYKGMIQYSTLSKQRTE
jgi:hypothetical protein